MAQAETVPDKVHLVGSIALPTVNDVFRQAGTILGRRLKRIPDGEPGGRRLWISWQYPVLRASPYLRVSPNQPRESATGHFMLSIADGVKPAEVDFGELGYAREARTSYQDFLAARERGEIAKGVRFQVCLPTPMAVIAAFCAGPDMVPIEKAYETAMIREVATLCAAIPHRDLSVQWDVCIEMIMWDGQIKEFLPPIPNIEKEIIARLARISAPVPDDVELGFHLCYGDWDAKHFVEPIDAAKMVTLANEIARAVKHPIAFMHLPVPIGRDDDAFFKPLADLKLAPATELYLGVVHGDGPEAVGRRIKAANKYVTGFGIATECGIARLRTPEHVTKILEIHAASSLEPSA